MPASASAAGPLAVAEAADALDAQHARREMARTACLPDLILISSPGRVRCTEFGWGGLCLSIASTPSFSHVRLLQGFGGREGRRDKRRASRAGRPAGKALAPHRH